MELYEIIAASLKTGGADVYIVPGSPIMMKTRGRFEPMNDVKLTAADTEILLREIYGMNSNRSLDDLLYSGEDEFSFAIQNLGRFRCSAYRQRGSLAALLRIVDYGLPDPQKLHIPEEVLELADITRGLVFVTGPTNSGKTTTLACMIDRINETRRGHIVTIENPIEFIHPHKNCIVTQREVRTDTSSFSEATKTAMRQGADAILLSMIPDAAALQNAINAVEMGCLVLAEGYIYSLSKLVSRLVDTVPESHQPLLRTWMALSLSAVVTQKLIPTLDGDVEPLFEVLRITPEMRRAIRDGENLAVYETGMDERIYELWKNGRISRDVAILHACDANGMTARTE